MHLVLLGDSIFDNSDYVNDRESVSEQLSYLMCDRATINLLAVDGAVAENVPSQLFNCPSDATHIFLSCGGNDALACLNILNMKAASVGDALEILSDVRHTFRCNYRKALAAVTDRPAETIVCTIYNRIPGISERALTALALFNEIILEEAALHGLPVLDLRAICTDATDYSPISPIEPSRQGGQKIARAICELLETDMRPARAGFD